MELFSEQLSAFLSWLLNSTLQASVLVCLILAIKAIARHRLSTRWHYCLWLLLLIRMAMPWAPESNVSVFNLIPFGTEAHLTDYVQAKPGDDTIDIEPGRVYEPAPVTGIEGSIDLGIVASEKVITEGQPGSKQVRVTDIAILPLVWLAGAFVLAIYVFAGSFKLWWIVKSQRPLTDQKILELLEDCKAQMGVQTVLGVVVTDKVKSPALFGFLRPRLLLPAGIIETLSVEQLRYVLLHELAHLKRHDIGVGWLVAALQVL
ncbi:MAG: M56 family metallopeptidase, partial [Planctomycetota bacterium]